MKDLKENNNKIYAQLMDDDNVCTAVSVYYELGGEVTNATYEIFANAIFANQPRIKMITTFDNTLHQVGVHHR